MRNYRNPKDGSKQATLQQLSCVHLAGPRKQSLSLALQLSFCPGSCTSRRGLKKCWTDRAPLGPVNTCKCHNKTKTSHKPMLTHYQRDSYRDSKILLGHTSQNTGLPMLEPASAHRQETTKGLHLKLGRCGSSPSSPSATGPSKGLAFCLPISGTSG